MNSTVQRARSFFGVNPADALKGPRKGWRTLALEEDLGRDVIQLLTPE